MNIKVKQRDLTDCGAACLASVASYYKLKLPVSRIRQWAGTDKKGTSAWGIIKAAEKMGMTAKGVRATPEALSELALPAIAHVTRDNLHHYVVIYKLSSSMVELMDPGQGEMQKMSLKEFGAEWSGVVILLSPSGSFTSGNHRVSNFERFRFLLLQHKGTLFQALIGAAVFTVLGLSTSIYIQKITDQVLLNGNINLLNLLSTSMLIVLVLQLFIGCLQTIYVLKTGQLIDARLILGYYKHLLKLPQSFFDSMRTGEIISRINDAVKIRAFINDSMISLVVNIFIVFFAFSLMFLYHWRLALTMLGVLPLYGFIFFLTNRLNKKRERIVMEQSAELEAQLVESIHSEKTIKQFGLEEHAHTKTEVRFISLLESAYKSGLNSIFSGNASLLVSQLFTIILFWSGSLYVMNREITVGQLMSFYALLGYFTGPVSSLIGMNKTYQSAMIAADRLFEIMDLEQEGDENLIDARSIKLGDIVFEQVCFSYGTRSEVFEKFDARFEKGKITALVGESGSGKTTVASLLQKLYPLDGGAIYLGETNIKYCSNESLRRLVGIVPQNLNLFRGTIIENIAVGSFSADFKKVISICERLGILNFIEALPNGFNTVVGEQGANLSGGQKQRLAIARALYHEPEILILDEASSALDSESESYFMDLVRELSLQETTVLLITHRLTTALVASKILVLENGRLIEQGTHEELLKKRGRYHAQWQNQIPVLSDEHFSVVP